MAKRKKSPSYLADLKAGARPVKRPFVLPFGGNKDKNKNGETRADDPEDTETPEGSYEDKVSVDEAVKDYEGDAPDSFEGKMPEAWVMPRPERKPEAPKASEENKAPEETEIPEVPEEAEAPEASEGAEAPEEAEALQDNIYGGQENPDQNRDETAIPSQEKRTGETVVEEKAPKEAEALSDDTKITNEPAGDVMPEFLRSANSTIRRDGPYKNYSGNADVLRYRRKEGDNKRGRSRRNRKNKKREGIMSVEAVSLIALIFIVGTIFFCAVRHVEIRELSLAVLIITSAITVIMGIMLREAPAYVSLILVAMIIVAGAVTGMFSEVITGSVIFLGTVTAVKGRFD